MNRALFEKFGTLALLSVTIAGTSANADTTMVSATDGEGTLTVVANGEDFVRQGFVTKDDWQINFERVAINVGEITAYQTEPAFNPDENTEIEATEKVTILDEVTTVDLAEGIESAEPIAVAQINAPAGSYDALGWSMIPLDDSGLSNQTIVLQGQAVKDAETVDFTLGFAVPVQYVCGEFVGDKRKGIVQQDESAEVEMTFHFDHIFGDRETPSDDPLNQDALGFQPLAELAQAGVLEADWQTLQQQLSAEDAQLLTEAIAGLGHVGEGHCKVKNEV